MDNSEEKLNDEFSDARDAALREHKTNLIAYSVVILAGVLFLTVLIPIFVKLKKNAEFGPERFPYMIAVLLTILGVVGLVSELVKMKKLGMAFPKFQFSAASLKAYLPQVLMIASGGVMVWLAPTIGFIPSAIVCMFSWLCLFRSKNKMFNAVFAICYTLLLYLLFSKVLGIRFTGGFLNF